MSVVMNGGGNVEFYRRDGDKHPPEALHSTSSPHLVQAPVIVQAPPSYFPHAFNQQSQTNSFSHFMMPSLPVSDQVSPITSNAASALNMLASSAAMSAKRSFETPNEDGAQSAEVSPKRSKAADNSADEADSDKS